MAVQGQQHMTIDRARVQAYIDDLAALTAAHGLLMQSSGAGALALHELRPECAIGGFAAIMYGRVWEVFAYTAGGIRPGWAELPERVASVDITGLSAHQSIAIKAALARMREALR